MPVRLVIFDCDGVLVDSEPIANRVLAGRLHAIGVAIPESEVMRRFVGKTRAQCLELAAQIRVRVTLGSAGLLPRFEGRIFTSADVANPKPAPDLFLHAAASMNAAPAECIVIEDTTTGVRAGRAAGMRVFGYIGVSTSDAAARAPQPSSTT